MQEAQVSNDMQSRQSQAVHQTKSCQMVWLRSSRTWWSDLAEPMSLWIQTGDGACLPSQVEHTSTASCLFLPCHVFGGFRLQRTRTHDLHAVVHI